MQRSSSTRPHHRSPCGCRHRCSSMRRVFTRCPLPARARCALAVVVRGDYFLLNTFAIAAAIALHEGVSALAMWRAHFQNLWVTFIGGAIGARICRLRAAVRHLRYGGSVAAASAGDRFCTSHIATPPAVLPTSYSTWPRSIGCTFPRSKRSPTPSTQKTAVTHGHIRRVQSCAVKLATRLGLEDAQQLRALEAGSSAARRR